MTSLRMSRRGQTGCRWSVLRAGPGDGSCRPSSSAHTAVWCPSASSALALWSALTSAVPRSMAGLAVLAAYYGPAYAAIAISAVNALFVMPYKPAVAAITPQLVSEDELAAANALYSTISKLAMIAGPALGAVLFSAI